MLYEILRIPVRMWNNCDNLQVDVTDVLAL